MRLFLAVIRAILLDPEARNDNPPSNFGRLRTPMQHTIAFTRALNLNPGPASQFAYLFYNMNEGILDAPSVFGHYSPLFHRGRIAPRGAARAQVPRSAARRVPVSDWAAQSPAAGGR